MSRCLGDRTSLLIQWLRSHISNGGGGGGGCVPFLVREDPTFHVVQPKVFLKKKMMEEKSEEGRIES